MNPSLALHKEEKLDTDLVATMYDLPWSFLHAENDMIDIHSTASGGGGV